MTRVHVEISGKSLDLARRRGGGGNDEIVEMARRRL